MSYKHHLTSHWAGCRLLAETRDHCRKRDVRLYLIPGEFDHIGVTDGTDAWVAPANVHSLFGVDVRVLLQRIRSGEDVKPVQSLVRARVRVQASPEVTSLTPSPTATRSRVRVQVSA